MCMPILPQRLCWCFDFVGYRAGEWVWPEWDIEELEFSRDSTSSPRPKPCQGASAQNFLLRLFASSR
jgi:hypothetical protein